MLIAVRIGGENLKAKTIVRILLSLPPDEHNDFWRANYLRSSVIHIAEVA